MRLLEFLLLQTSGVLVGHGRDFSKHLQTVRIHDSNAAKGGALFKGFHKEGLAWFEFDLGILKLREFRGVFDLLSTRLLGLLPQDLGHLARHLGGTAKDHRAVAWFEDTGVLLHRHHGSERFGGLEFTLLHHVDDVTGLDLFILGNTLDGKTDRVTGSGEWKLLLVLFNGEDFLSLEAGWDDTDFITRLERTLFDSSADDLTYTLDIVNVGNGQTDRESGVSFRRLNEVVEALDEGESRGGDLRSDVGRPSLVPGALVGLFDKIVSVESRVGDEGHFLGLEANELKHLNEFLLDFVEAIFGPTAGVHLVHSTVK